MEKHNRFERILSWVLTAALLWSMATPPGFQLGSVSVAAAGTEDPAQEAAPTMTEPVRSASGWVSKAVYTFTAQDDVGIASAKIIDSENKAVDLTQNGSGAYVAEVTANGTYTLRVEDADGNHAQAIITETQVDPDDPVITKVERHTTDIVKKADYLLTAEDALSGIEKVTLQTVGGEEEELTANSDGSYSFTVLSQDTYTVTVYDKAGNTAVKEISDTQIDVEGPAFKDISRKEEGWQKEKASYSIQIEDLLSGIDTVTFGKKGEEAAALTPNEDGSYTVTVTENGEYEITATDKLGTASSKVITEEMIDKTAPSVEPPVRLDDAWSQAPQYTIKAADEESGIARVVAVSGTSAPIEAALQTDGTYLLTVPANGTYTVTVTNNAGSEVQTTITEEKADITPPEIVNVTRRDNAWATEADYTFEVTDNASGVKEVAVTVGTAEPEILTASDGKYSFTVKDSVPFQITAVDAAGNTTSHDGTESKVDISGPEISAPARQESGWIDGTANYTFTVTDSQSGVKSVTLLLPGGESKTLSGTNGKYSFDLDSNTAFTVTAVDNLGNTKSVNGEETRIDKENPFISTPVRSEGDWTMEANYSFTVKDACGVKSVTVTVGSKNVAVSQNGNTYSFAMATNEAYAITAVDNLGHISTIAGSETKVDTVDPEITGLKRTEDAWVTSANYSFRAADALSGISSVTVTDEAGKTVKVNGADGSYSFTLTANGKYTVEVKDAAGNSANKEISENYIDTAAPEILDVQRKDESWQQNTSYSFRIAQEQSGVKTVTVRYGADGEQTLTPDEAGLYSFEVAANGTYEIVATDMVGNTNSHMIREAYIDTTAPEVVDFARSEAGWNTASHYSFTVKEEQSGLSSVELTIGSGNAVAMKPDEDGVYSFELTDNLDFQIVVADSLGNTDTLTGTESRIDTTAPVISEVKRQGSGWATSATYSFTAEEPASGIQSVSVTFGSGEEKTLTAVNGIYSFTMTGNATFTVTAVDAVGNTSTAEGEETKVDATAPAIAQPQRNAEGWATNVTYSFTLTETQSGVSSVTYTLDGGASIEIPAEEDGTYTFPVSENGTYTVTATDAVGNVESVDITESFIDTTAPAIEELNRTVVGWATSATYSFRVSDAQSGVAAVSVVIGDGEPQELTAENGLYSFSMNENAAFEIVAIDAVGNTSTTQGKETYVDTTAPEIPEPQRLARAWSYSAEYKIIVLETQSGIQSVTVQPQDGEAVTLQPSEDGTYSYTATTNTSYTVTAVDMVGNTSSVTFTEQQVDFTAPAVTEIDRDPDVWSQESTYTFKVKDTQSGIQNVEVLFNGENVSLEGLGGGVYRFEAVANGEYTIRATDVVGNKTEIFVGESLIDLQAPEIHAVEPQQTWDASENTVFMKVTDESELVSVQVFDADGKEYTVASTGQDLFETVVDKNGDYTVKATDRAGNSTTEGFTVWHIDTEIPSTPVVTSSANEAWVNTDVTVTAYATDSQSGVEAYWYSTESSSFDPDTWTKMELGEGSATAVISAEMDTNCYVVAQDEVGRISEPGKVHIYIDKTAPSGLSASYITEEGSGFNRIVDGKYIYNDKVSFQACANDPASGVVRYDYRIEGSDGTSTEWSGVAANEEGFSKVIAGMKDDIYTVWIRAHDLAGNCCAEYTVTADGVAVQHILENTPANDTERSPVPDVALTADGAIYSGSWTNKDVTVQVSGSSAVSGIEFYEYAVDYADPAIEDTSWQQVPMANGVSAFVVSKDTNATYSFRAVTYAGNRSQVTTRTVKVQKTAPVAATLTQDKATGTHGWYTQIPGYAVYLPQQNEHFAPVRYEIRYTHNDGEEIVTAYDGTNAPKITADGTWSFTIWAIDETGNSSAVAESTANFSVDTVVPTGLGVTLNGQSILSVSSGGASQWSGVNSVELNQPSEFHIFRNRPVTVHVSANGGDSGMDALYYQIVAEDSRYSKDGPWTKMDSASVTLTPDSKCRLYFKAVDYAGNITYFTAKSILMDATAPVVSELKAEAKNRSAHGLYYGDVTISVTAKEPSVGADHIYSGIKSVSYRVLMDGSVTQSGQLYPGGTPTAGEGGRVTDWTGSFVIDAKKNNSNNIVVEVTVYDQAGNSTTSYIREGTVKIDVDEPTMVSSYDRNDITRSFGGDDIFTGSRTLTVVATERNFSPSESYVRVTDSDTGRTVTHTWTSDGDTHTAVIPVTADGHYKVSAVVTDTAGNKTTQMGFVDGTVAASAFVIDNTAPVIVVTYDNNDVRNGIYFSSARTATVKVTERNFDPDNILLYVRFAAENGNISRLRVSNWTHEGSEHCATIVCEESGSYGITVSGKDAVGHTAPAAKFMGASATGFIVDTHIEAPEFTDVADGSAYSGRIVPVVTVRDTNLEDFSIQIFRTRRNESRKDITNEIPAGSVTMENVDSGKKISIDAFTEGQDNDGVYEIIVLSIDKAGNTVTGSVKFSVNRNGSVYVYDDNLSGVMGRSIQRLDKDIVITEYNPSGLVAGSARVYITVDGVPIADPIYTVTPKADGTEKPGQSGWYEYQYVISWENFTTDGQYEVVISTEDAAGNVPENTSEDTAIRFAIDTTAPEIPSIVGMEEAIYKADSIDVTFTASDNVALASVVVYIDGEEAAQWEDLSDFQLEDVFTITSGLERHVRIVVTDAAGNVLDTDSENFVPGYTMKDKITVSTNFWLRYYANKPLFYGSIIGSLSLLAIILFLLFKRRKDKEDPEQAQPEQ